jgi:hypothetical protein
MYSADKMPTSHWCSSFFEVEILYACTVGLVELSVFGSWYDTSLFRDMICLLDILKHSNVFQTRDTEQKVQAAYFATRKVVG